MTSKGRPPVKMQTPTSSPLPPPPLEPGTFQKPHSTSPTAVLAAPRRALHTNDSTGSIKSREAVDHHSVRPPGLVITTAPVPDRVPDWSGEPRTSVNSLNDPRITYVASIGTSSEMGTPIDGKFSNENITFADKDSTNMHRPVVRVSSFKMDSQSEEMDDRSTLYTPTHRPLEHGDEQGEASAGSESGRSGRSSAMDSMMTDMDQRHSKVYKCIRKVPFPIWVSIAMAIPLCFLMGLQIDAVVGAAGTRDYIREHLPLQVAAAQCQDSLMIERGSTTIVVTWNTTKGFATMIRARPLTDENCNDLLELSRNSPDSQINDFAEEFQESLRTISVVRFKTDIARIINFSSTEQRSIYTAVVRMTDRALSLLAINKKVKSGAIEFFELKYIQSAINQLGICRAVGAEILGLNGSHLSDDLLVEFALCRSHYVASVNQLDDIQPDHIFNRDPNKLRAKQMIDELFEKPRSIHPWSTDEWFATFTLAIDLQGFSPEFLKDAQHDLVKNVAILISVGTATIISAAFIMWLQIDNMHRIDRAFVRAHDMQRAIAKFVPRAFLRLTGCTSILQVTVGSHTPVAVSMLFSDIRDFTTLSAGMGCETLFVWLEGYLKRMTKITEAHRGFVDKFIGDAVFSVFIEPRHAIGAGIDMQMETEQLNTEMRCAGGSNMLRIGVGVHHGVAAAGFLGDENRVTATLISSEVNLASRLEGLTKFYGAKILISGSAAAQLDATMFRMRRIGKAKVKGALEVIEIVEVFTTDDNDIQSYKEATKEKFEKAVNLRNDGKLDESRALFLEVQETARMESIIDKAVEVNLDTTDAVDEWAEK